MILIYNLYLREKTRLNIALPLYLKIVHAAD